MRFDIGSIMAPLGNPSKMTGRDQLSIGGIGGGQAFDTSQFLTRGDMPTAFDPSNLQSGIAGLRDRLDNLNIPEYKAPDLSGFARIEDLPQIDTSKFLTAGDLPRFDPRDYRDDFLSIAREGIQIPEYKAPDLSGFARKEDLPTFDRDALRDELFKDIRGSIKVPEAPVFDRDALIEDIRSGIDIPKPPSFDREKLIEDIRGGINIPKFDRESLIKDIRSELPTPPAFDRNKLIEDIRGQIDIPQVPDLSAFDTRFADLQKRIDELSQRQGPQPSIPTVEPILTNDLPQFLPGQNPATRQAPPMSIGGPGGGRNMTGREELGLANLISGQPLVPGSAAPKQLPVGGPGLSLKRDDFMSIDRVGDERTPFDPNLGGTPTPPDTGMPDPNTRISNYYTDRQFGAVPVNPQPVQPAPTEPAAVAPTAGADPTQTQMPMGAIDPVLLQQQTSEKLTDPLIRSLYFGTQDSPGFYQQLQQAGANLIGSDVPLQQTAGLSPLELLARQKAVAGLGGFEPFLQQNRDLVNQAIAQSRRAEELQDPYYTQAEEIYKDTMGAYDPSMTQQFYNPYEDAVVQQTIEDVMKAGDKQDIAERAREISAGAFGGSRARLGAEERRQDLGEGLAKALSGIRQTGYQSAQATGLGEFARQQAAKRTGAEGLMGIGIGRGSAASQLGSQLAGYGSQIGGIGSTQEGLRAGQRGELSGYGGVGRGIAETGLGRIFEQQVGQQYRPMQTLGQIGSMLPGYQASQTQIDSGYGMPTDPTAAGLGAAFSAYGALAPRQEGQG